MKIGIDCRMLGSLHGGIGRYVFELVKHLLLLDKQNEYVLFFNSENQAEVLKAAGQRGRVALAKADIRHYSVKEQYKFTRILNGHSLDLVHFPNFNVPLLYKGPFVVTIHDMVHHKISGAKKSRYLHFFAYKKVIQNAGSKARAIITVSKASKADIVKYLNVLPRKVEVIYEGGPKIGEVQKELVMEIKDKYFLRRPYFLFVGVLERKKNLVNLTRGFDRFVEKYKFDMDLVIAGRQDPHYPEIRRQALDIKNRNRLVFTGWVEEQQLRALYQGAYAYVSASAYEGFGLPGLEAMAFGLPLVVSNTGVFNEIYDNSAVYFDPFNPGDIAEKLDLLAKDPKFYESLSKNSRARFGFFDWEKTAKETLRVYNECKADRLSV